VGKHADLSAEAQRTFHAEALSFIEHVRRFARSLCHNATDTDDLVQETYLRAYRSWYTFELGTDCRRWLFTICRNVYRRQMRDTRDMVGLHALAASSSARPNANVFDLEPADTANEYEDLITRMDVANALDSALPLVPEPYRSTLIIVLVQDQTYEAAAAQLDVPVGTVRSRLSRGRRLVQDFLTPVALDAGVSVASALGRPRQVATCADQQSPRESDEQSRPWPRKQHRVHTELPER